MEGRRTKMGNEERKSGKTGRKKDEKRRRKELQHHLEE